jgi:hypothetical protein
MAVYFIQHAPDGLIKIGWSGRPAKRMAAMQVGCPVPLVLRCAITEADYFDQANIQVRFVKHLARGEWFHPADEILEVIGDYNAGGDLWQSHDVVGEVNEWLHQNKHNFKRISQLSGISTACLKQITTHNGGSRSTSLAALIAAKQQLDGAA